MADRNAVHRPAHLTHYAAKLASAACIEKSKAIKIPTSAYKDLVWPGGAGYGLNNSNNGKFMYVAGGIPIKIDGEVVGAVGCSTGTVSTFQDIHLTVEGNGRDCPMIPTNENRCLCSSKY